MMLPKTVNKIASDVKNGKAKPRDVLNLIKEFKKIQDWETKSFEEVDEVIAVTSELQEFINVAQGFPKSTIEGLKLCGILALEVRELRKKIEEIEETEAYKEDLAKEKEALTLELEKLNKELEDARARNSKKKTKKKSSPSKDNPEPGNSPNPHPASDPD